MNDIVPSNVIVTQTDFQRVRPDEYAWLRFFDPDAALQAVRNHVETLPGSRHERHTMRAYLGSLADFCAFAGARVIHYGAEEYDFVFTRMTMPSKPLMQDYIAVCSRRGLSSKTITRYLAAVRLFLKALEEQPVTPGSGGDFMFIMEAQRQFRLAVATKNPAPDRSSNRPALEQFGHRLSLHQVNRLLESFEPEMRTVTGKRDLALLYLGITSGLRAAELARVTLDSIQPGRDCYEVRVRGKRSNFDPIGIDATAYALILDYVQAYNTRLAKILPSPSGEGSGVRALEPHHPVFQPLRRGDHPLPGHDPALGISARAILKIVERRTHAALGSAIAAHDMRRTCAYLMRSHGFEWDQIRSQLRHRSIGTTEKYVGQEQDLSRALLSKRVHFHMPAGAAGETEMQS